MKLKNVTNNYIKIEVTIITDEFLNKIVNVNVI